MSATWQDWQAGRLGFLGLIQVLWSKRLLIAAVAGVTTLAFGVAAFVLPKTYRATAVLVPVSMEQSSMGALGSALSQLGGLASLAGVKVGGADSELQEALAVFRSRHFTDRFIADEKLAPQLFADKWDAAAGRWRVAAGSEPTPARAYDYFDKKVRTVARDTKTGLVTLKIEWRDRVAAAAWANALVERINLEMRDRAATKANASLKYLEAELRNTTEVGTREAIYRLIEAQVKQRMLANVTQDYAFRVVDPALVADADKYVWPRKGISLALGLLVGLALGIGIALAAAALAAARASLQRPQVQ